MPPRHFKLIISLLLIITSLSCLSQTDSDKVKPYPYIALHAGLSLPLGPFATSSKGEYDGQIGYNIGISCAYPMGLLHFGEILQVSYSANAFDASNILNNSYGQGFIGDVEHSGSFTERNFLGGIYYSLPGDDRSSIDIRLLAGSVFFSSPEINFVETNPGSTGNAVPTMDIRPSHFIAFTYDIGASFRCLLGRHKRLIFLMNADLYYTNFGGDAIITYGPGPGNSLSSVRVTLFYSTVGLGYRLGK